MLLESIEASLPEKIYIPKPLKELFEWIDKNNLSVKYKDKYVRGYLAEDEYGAKDGLYFSSENREIYHFRDNPQAKSRFFPIMYYGDGIYEDGAIGLWLDDEDKQHIVYIGDYISAPMDFFIIVDSFKLLQLLSIGYCNILYWYKYYNDWLDKAPETDDYKRLNSNYREWFKAIYNCEIPNCAYEVIPHFTSINDEDADDKFLQWDREHNKLWEECKYKKMLYDKINTLFPEVGLEEQGGYYGFIHLSLFQELMFWIEDPKTDTKSEDFIKRVKELSAWVYDNYQDPKDDSGCIHIYSEYIVSFLEDIFNNKKLHHIILELWTKEEVIKDKEFIIGYMHTSDDEYRHLLSLYDNKEELKL